MSKIKVDEHINKETGEKRMHTQYLYFCMGCGYEHAFALKSEGGFHEFNGDLDKPTVNPSLLNDWTPGRKCHSYIKDGMIQYLPDCWHELKGQTIELPEITKPNDSKH